MWHRVTKQNKCPVCGHDTWCIYIEDVVICMRQESKHPKVFKDGSTGWLHKEMGSHPSSTTNSPPKPTPVINCRKLIDDWDHEGEPDYIHNLAHALGVSTGSLAALSCCWAREHRAWAFPMKDGYENMVGIRLRSASGFKWAVPGSHAGLFIPMVKPNGQTAIIVEGPTDTAAALDMGYYAVGRPSCSGGATHLVHLIRRHNIKRAVVVADNDDPGVNGAKSLVSLLPVPCAIVVLPCKDMRDFRALGGTKQMLDARIEGSVWLNT